MRYLLLEESRYREEELAPMRNLVAALFRLENSREPEDVQRVLGTLLEWLQAPEQGGLRRAFTVWLRRVLLPGRLPGVRLPEEWEDLQEVRAMLAERVVEWTRPWREEGLEEGRQEGQAMLLLRLLERKFGPLEETHRQRTIPARGAPFQRTQ